MLFIALVGIVVGVGINFANLHTDFQDLRDFHRGYMGRRMLISEGSLTSREYLKALSTIEENKRRPPKRPPKVMKSFL